MKKLVIGVPCCNDAQYVRETLAPVIDEYREWGVDVYYYDSSENNEIRDIVRNYRDRGYDNIYHIPFDTPEVINKIELFFSSYGLADEYEYYWPLKTYSCIKPGHLPKLMNALDREYDVVYLDYLGALDRSVISDDAAGFYNAFGWSATSIDVTIYRKDTLLSGFVFSEDMLSSPVETMRYYPHWFILFNELSKLDSPRILVLDQKTVMLKGVRRKELRYVDTIFDVWKDKWIVANDALPELYAPYKDKVIREAAGKSHLIAHIPRLIELHEKGVLRPDNLPDILKNWERVSDIPKDVVIKIANDTYCPTDHSADKLLNDGYDEEIEIFSKIFQCFSEGTLSGKELPAEDMASMLTERLRNAFSGSGKYISEILSRGTARDLKECLLDPGRTKQEKLNALQQMSLMLALTKLIKTEESQ